jgi:hypothetical protein
MKTEFIIPIKTVGLELFDADMANVGGGNPLIGYNKDTRSGIRFN